MTSSVPNVLFLKYATSLTLSALQLPHSGRAVSPFSPQLLPPRLPSVAVPQFSRRLLLPFSPRLSSRSPQPHRGAARGRSVRQSPLRSRLPRARLPQPPGPAVRSLPTLRAAAVPCGSAGTRGGGAASSARALPGRPRTRGPPWLPRRAGWAGDGAGLGLEPGSG